METTKDVAKHYAEEQAQKSIKSLEKSFTVFTKKRERTKRLRKRYATREESAAAEG